jgi:hypothetical protein
MGLLGTLAGPVIRPIRKYQNRRSRDFVLRCLPKHSIGAEIGVFEGNFSDRILHVVQPAKLYLIDPWKYQPAPEFNSAWYGGAKGESQARMDQRHRSVVDRFRSQIARGVVEVQRGNSRELVAAFADHSFDWIYVDGDHRYEGTLNDLHLAHRKLKPTGLVAGDDYDAVTEWWADGVRRAVRDAVREGLYDVALIYNNQFLLRPLNNTKDVKPIESSRNLSVSA